MHILVQKLFLLSGIRSFKTLAECFGIAWVIWLGGAAARGFGSGCLHCDHLSFGKADICSRPPVITLVDRCLSMLGPLGEPLLLRCVLCPLSAW